MLNACTKYIRMKHSIDERKTAERQVMTIINVTEDSFYDGSRTFTSGEIERRAAAAAEQGYRYIRRWWLFVASGGG